MEATMMEGFWVLQFSGTQGWGTGVATLINGQIFGGDSAFVYYGTYKVEGASFRGRVHVQRYVSPAVMPIVNVMGMDQFDLELTGNQVGNTITVTGVIPGTQLRLNGTLAKQHDLPMSR
jgi:hypothetical protein